MFNILIIYYNYNKFFSTNAAKCEGSNQLNNSPSTVTRGKKNIDGKQNVIYNCLSFVV